MSTALARLAFAVGLHLLFLASVFDIYFRSPVIPSAKQHAPKYEAPAKRLILFVADGLRADSLYNHPDRAPYLARVANSLGSWGVSHTRVPTESRPGHVAIIAGMFEDPSAITKGWQENPVDFDTVFNQSDRVWSWGSPDILPMFARGSWNHQVEADMYEPSLETFFSNSDISRLDSWVFDKVDRFFARANEDADLKRDLRGDKIVLFLHLLGLDTNGHTNKPNSKIYAENLKLVDEGVKNVVKQCENFWRHDGRTAYIFTADHGMTDWGSHGAGMDHETKTPILAWGAGVQQPGTVGSTGFPELSRQKQKDVNQTDIAPLMSSLLGTNVPQHSVGKLPLDYLSFHDLHRVEAKMANALQIHEQYVSFKRRCEETSFPMLFKRRDPVELDMAVITEKIEEFKTKANYKEALRLADEVYEQSLAGLFHYQRYHRLPLYVAASASYLGFIAYTALVILKNYSSLVLTRSASDLEAVAVYILASIGLLYSVLATLCQNVPLHFFLYYLSPFLVWTIAIREFTEIELAPSQKQNVFDLTKTVIVCLMAIEAMVWTFFDRRWLTAAILIVMLLQLKSSSSTSKTLKSVWTCLCFILAVIAFQPTVGKERSSTLVLISGIVSASVSFIKSKNKMSLSNAIAVILLALSGLCVWVTAEVDSPTLVDLFRVLSWAVLILAFPVAWLSPPILLPRLLALTAALQAIYQLLSLTYEGLFLICLNAALFVWLIMEHRKSFVYQTLWAVPVTRTPIQRNIVTNEDFYRALAFLTFTIVSFFGTGNIASLNSFDPRSIQSLVAVFNPFLMGGLLLLKIVIPFFVVSLFAFAVQHVTQMPRQALFLIVLLFSDVMGLHFFFMVTDQGSWLEIGTSLSHFVIVEGTVIFLQVLFHLSSVCMRIKVFTTASDKESEVIVIETSPARRSKHMIDNNGDTVHFKNMNQ